MLGGCISRAGAPQWRLSPSTNNRNSAYYGIKDRQRKSMQKVRT